MKIDKENKDKIINFGAFEYGAEKMSNILNESKESISLLMDNKKSEFYQLYKKGRDVSDYVIDLKLFEMAKSGDIKALDKFNHRKRLRK